jgi:hypothetical protein
MCSRVYGYGNNESKCSCVFSFSCAMQTEARMATFSQPCTRTFLTFKA